MLPNALVNHLTGGFDARPHSFPLVHGGNVPRGAVCPASCVLEHKADLVHVYLGVDADDFRSDFQENRTSTRGKARDQSAGTYPHTYA